MVYSLYVKEHNKTGLKYLGQTSQDPYKYKGSGKYWKEHIRVHGNDVTTFILGTFEDKKHVAQLGEYISKTYNIVESNEWANLMVEKGDGIDSQTAYKLKVGKRNKGYVCCRNKNGNTFRVSQQEFSSRPDLIGMNIGGYKLQPGANKGCKNPMYRKQRSDLIIRNSQPKAWITNGSITKLINKPELDKYLQDGFVRGRL